MRARIGLGLVGLLVLGCPTVAWAGDPVRDAAIAQPIFASVMPGTTVAAASSSGGDVLTVNVPDQAVTDEGNWRVKMAAALSAARLPDMTGYVMSGAPFAAGAQGHGQPGRFDTVNTDLMRAQADSNGAIISQQFATDLTSARVEDVVLDAAANAMAYRFVFGVRSLQADPAAVANALVGAPSGLLGLAEGIAVVVCDPQRCVYSYAASRAGWGAMSVLDDSPMRVNTTFPNLAGGDTWTGITHSGPVSIPVLTATLLDRRHALKITAGRAQNPKVTCVPGRALTLKFTEPATSVGVRWKTGVNSRATPSMNHRSWTFKVPTHHGQRFTAQVSLPHIGAPFTVTCR